MIKVMFFLWSFKRFLLFSVYKTNILFKLLKLINFIFILFFSMMFFTGIFVFCSKRKHLLLILLRLEYIILSLYILIFINLSMYDYEYYFRIMFLTFCVCERVLGLRILVSLIRTHGNDLFFSINILC